MEIFNIHYALYVNINTNNTHFWFNIYSGITLYFDSSLLLQPWLLNMDLSSCPRKHMATYVRWLFWADLYLQRVVRTARHIVGGELPSLQDIYTRGCTRKARRIIKDSSHPSHRLLSLLPSGRRLRSIRSRTSRLRDSFFPQAIRLMNSKN